MITEEEDLQITKICEDFGILVGDGLNLAYEIMAGSTYIMKEI